MTTNARIVVDCDFFERDVVSGIARVWAEILQRWSTREIGKRIVLLRRGQMLSGLPDYPVRDIPPLSPELWESDPPIVQEMCDELGAAIFLSTYYTHPIHTRSVLWIHDMIPERLNADLSRAVWRQKHAAMEQATAYACSSHHSLKDLRRFSPANAAKPAVVAGCGVSEIMQPITIAEAQKFHEAFVKPKLGGRPYLFMPGNTEAYKNGILLVDVLSRIDCSNLAVLVTMPSSLTAKLRAIPNLIVHNEYFYDKSLRLAYGGAHCLVYPSMYEGFGLPVAEAMACGCPVICAGTSSLPEVAGDAAILIDPQQPDSLAQALKAMDRPEVRQTLIARGLIQAKKFNWNTVASALEALVMDTIAA